MASGHPHKTLEGLRGRSLTELRDHVRRAHPAGAPGWEMEVSWEFLAGFHRHCHPETPGPPPADPEVLA